MSHEIFDQAQPRSRMAQRLDEAFAGCEEWTLAPASPRRSDLDIAPWLSGPRRSGDDAAFARSPKSRAA